LINAGREVFLRFNLRESSANQTPLQFLNNQLKLRPHFSGIYLSGNSFSLGKEGLNPFIDHLYMRQMILALAQPDRHSTLTSLAQVREVRMNKVRFSLEGSDSLLQDLKAIQATLVIEGQGVAEVSQLKTIQHLEILSSWLKEVLSNKVHLFRFSEIAL
jgi:hypothetical protein